MDFGNFELKNNCLPKGMGWVMVGWSGPLFCHGAVGEIQYRK